MSGTNHGHRPKEIEARKAAFAAARIMLKDNTISQSEAAKQTGCSRNSVSSAMMILQHGTIEEIAGVEGGLLGLDRTADKVRSRTTPEQREASRRAPARSVTMVQAIQIDADVWQKLKAGLEAINSLPSPKDTAAIVRKNVMRIEHVNRNLLAAISWIREFEDEITQ